MTAKMTKSALVFAAGVALMLFVVGVGAADLATQCAADFQKVVACLSFASGRAAEPSKECCDAVTGIKGKDPQCLCYIIEQAHNGSQQLKSMGVQEAKLMQLPSACKLQNASVSECPKLLGLSPSSPAAAVFSANSSTETSSGGAKGAAADTSPTQTKDASMGAKLGFSLLGLLPVVVALFLYGSMFSFPAW